MKHEVVGVVGEKVNNIKTLTYLFKKIIKFFVKGCHTLQLHTYLQSGRGQASSHSLVQRQGKNAHLQVCRTNFLWFYIFNTYCHNICICFQSIISSIHFKFWNVIFWELKFILVQNHFLRAAGKGLPAFLNTGLPPKPS